MQLAYPIGVAQENPKQEESGQTAVANSPRQVHRRAKLKDLLKDNGGIAGVAKNESERTYLQAVLSGKRGLGDRKAAELEARYKRNPGWFDAPFEADSGWPFRRVSLERVKKLQPDDLHRVEGRLAAALEWVESTPSEAQDNDAKAAQDAKLAAGTFGVPGLPDSVNKNRKVEK